MIRVRLVERLDGDWCAFIEGQEENAVEAATDDAALGRLLRQHPDQFGITAVDVMTLDPRLSGESATRFRGEQQVVGPDSSAPELRSLGDEGAGGLGDRSALA